MCIALISTAHPAYQLVLISNRDEYLNRPTAPASWWPEPNSNVLGGRDLLRSIQGTWLGVTTDGRIAALTNFRETGVQHEGAASRGVVVRAFLTDNSFSSTDEFVRGMVASGAGRDAGGFSLVCGKIGEPLAVMSNRAKSEDDIPWIATVPGETIGLSNAAFGDRSWPKVTQGEEMMRSALSESVQAGESEDQLIKRLLDLLSTDTLPRHGDEAGLETYINDLRKTIFVPTIGRKDPPGLPADKVAAARKNEKMEVLEERMDNKLPLGVSGLYGTQKQSVILVSHSRRVRFIERTLHDNNVNPIPLGEGDREFVFEVKA
jgi:uncharacterized protein with NRDE domain